VKLVALLRLQPARPRPPTTSVQPRIQFGLAVVLLVQAVAAVAATDSASVSRSEPIVSAPPADVRAVAAQPRAKLVAPARAASRRVALAPPRADELAPLSTRMVIDKRQPLAIGVGREVADVMALRDLAWQPTDSGTRTARVDIVSSGAAAVRVALQFNNTVAGLVARFSGSRSDAEAFAVPGADISRAAQLGNRYWSPVVSGDTVSIELETPVDVSLDGVTMSIPRLSHLVVDGADLLAPAGPVARATGIGAAGSCNIDVACIAASNPAAAELAKSVARLSFVRDDGRTFLCTGTILADSVASNTPYLLTANHCITSASVAQTINTYWFYAATICNSKAVPQYVQLTSGARLLGRSQDNDWAIVKLNETPPAGTKYAAWRAEPLANGTTVISVHHPAADLAKFSSGQVTNDVQIVDDLVNGVFNEVVWSEGVTEGGSSGGAIATLTPGGAYYEVRGGLYEGSSACGSLFSHLPDYYSHLTTALPVMRQYLTPNAANPDGIVVAVEFYNANLGHYFLSTDPVEIDNLDSGRTVGWVRTGLRFLVYDHQAPGTSAVCRFYRAPSFGDSHFYSASAQECAQTAAAHPVDWVYESSSVFYVTLPNASSGACAAGTTPVYRFFNAQTTNHRYTAERYIRDDMTATPSVWTAEGYGPGPYLPVMCAVAQ